MAITYVLNQDGQPLMPTTRCGKVRRLLNSGQARVVRKRPFTIQLNYEPKTNVVKDLTLGVDAGSKTIGLSVTSENREYYASEVKLRDDVSKLLESRSNSRYTRRNRKIRYRKPRFNNRTKSKPKGWIAPSIKHKVQTHVDAVKDIMSFLPIKQVIVETAQFDTQKMVNPEISGVEYQQGELMGYHIREYLLEKFKRQCVYCKKKNIPLEIEHIIPKSRGGSNRVNNLTIACRECNQRKDNMTAAEFGFPKVQKQASKGLKHAAHMNLIRKSFLTQLQELGIDVKETFGYITKKTRIDTGLEKTHAIDARCITGNVNVQPIEDLWLKKKVRRHNRSIHKMTLYKGGVKRAKQAPYETQGYRLFDLVSVDGALWYVHARRVKGGFTLKRMSDGNSLNKAPSKITFVAHQPSYIQEKVPNTGVITLMK